MSEDDLIDKIFDALEMALANSDITLSRIGRKIILDDGKQERVLCLFVPVKD